MGHLTNNEYRPSAPDSDVPRSSQRWGGLNKPNSALVELERMGYVVGYEIKQTIVGKAYYFDRYFTESSQLAELLRGIEGCFNVEVLPHPMDELQDRVLFRLTPVID